MKKYNIKNYVRYKDDVKRCIESVNLKDLLIITLKNLK